MTMYDPENPQHQEYRQRWREANARVKKLREYPHLYKLLKHYGHSPIKAVEIVWDAKRADPYALRWIRLVFRTRFVRIN